jgi:alpha-mannosidase
MDHEQRWTADKIAQRIDLVEALVYRRRLALPDWRFLKMASPSVTPPVQPGLDDSGWEVIPTDTVWGGARLDFTLRTRFSLPLDWDPAHSALFLPIGIAHDFSHPETLAYIDGQAVSSIDRHHQEVRLPAEFCDGNEQVLALHGWCGGVRADQSFRLLMRACFLVEVDPIAREFHALARAALGIANVLDKNHPARYQLLTSLDNAFKRLDLREPFDEGFYSSLPAALDELRAGIARSGEPMPVDITAAGHAHIDVAWLWPLAQTRRKAGRTFYNAIRLSEQFPDFIFSQSQPQLYDFVRQDYPALFELIRSAVARGAWEPMGGMWVEADCNLSGAESLARQFLLGRSFFRKYFGEGVESPVLWLPDVFGYAWNLPQLIKEAGLEYFFTIKIGWNQYNRLPFDSFWWQGLDGTRVLTHFSTTPEHPNQFRATYNAKASPDQVMDTWTNATQKETTHPGVYPPLLMSYGHGDGGGGPTREMLEDIRNLGHFPATPHIHFGRVKEYFRKLESDLGPELPTWNGELYLELHRGTYTTQGRNKRANRESEFALHDAEFLAALASRLDPAYTYPYAVLARAWELTCLNQFHDIIPGSSIHQVYVDSQEQYAEILQSAQAVRDGALAALAARAGGGVVVANPTSFARREAAFWATNQPASLRDARGALLPAQVVDGGLLFDPGVIPPYSVSVLAVEAGVPVSTEPGAIQARPNLLENDFLRVELNAAGDICSIFDKTNAREVLPEGAVANQLQAFEDRPKKWDAWDMDVFYDDKQWLAEPAESMRLVEIGPLRAALEIRRRVLHSQVVQRISLTAFSARLDIETWIDWRERHIFLKVAFPVDVLSPQATYEIQWGNVQRPTHRNTSWDWARFETCAHKWVDLSEGGYGVSLLNDCKYGHDIHDNVLRLSLLRAPTNPDPEADQGKHHFTYSLLPHAGSWDENTIAQAYFLNDPLVVAALAQGDYLTYGASEEVGPAEKPAPGAFVPLSLLSVDAPNLIVETVKAAEDGRGLIVRLYESQRRRGSAALTCAFPLAAAWRTNLLEEDQSSLTVEDSTVRFEFRPYQIITLRVEFL